MHSVILLLALGFLPQVPAAVQQTTVLVEAESFSDVGGWVVDPQFMDIMGSPYLLAHGLGIPVAYAETNVTLPVSGTYRIWVRTKDWVARWDAPGTPGRFRLALNNQDLAPVFGTVGADWHWQDGGVLELVQGKTNLRLHDLTGFEGRCDAIILTTDLGFENLDFPEIEFRDFHCSVF